MARAEFGTRLAEALAGLPVLDVRSNVVEAVGLAIPRSIAALLGPDPRVIADEI